MNAPRHPVWPASDGTEQRQRLPAALVPGYFAVDELPLEARVAMVASLAAQLSFKAEPEPVRRMLALSQPGGASTDLDFELLVAESAGLAWPPQASPLTAPAGPLAGERDAGTWGDLFATDEALLLARLAAVDLDTWQARFLRGLETLPLERVAFQIAWMAAALDHWYRSLQVVGQPAATALADRIHQFIEQQLGAELQALLERHGRREWAGRPIAQVRQQLSDAWAALPLPRPSGGALAATAASRPEREQLRARFFSFLNAFARVQQLARQHLPASLRSERHEPAVGLMLAFLQLYGSAQQRINRFSEQLTDFYYERCLRLQPQPAQADRVHLVCRRDAQALQTPIVRAGTGFGAGKDEAGRPIEFRAEGDLLLGDAQVAALCSLRLERDPLISPERDFGYVTRAKVAQIEPAPLGADAVGPLPHWPLFGGTGSAASVFSGAPAAVDAPLGLVIASPLLWLKEGDREIRVNLYLQAAAAHPAEGLEALLQAQAQHGLSPQAFADGLGRYFAHWLLAEEDDLTDEALARLRAAFEHVLQLRSQQADAPRAGAGNPPPREENPMQAADPLCLLRGPGRPERAVIFDQVFEGLFTVSLSTETGWWEAHEAYVVRAEPSEVKGRGGLQLVVQLGPQAPPLVGCNPQVHGEGWGTALPLMRLQVRGQSSVYPYSLLDTLMLDEVNLAVEVHGARDLVLHNNLGRLDASKSFNPFGPLPTTASYLVFGSPEMARKNVTAVRLQLEWGELPPGDDGFGAHYAGYDTPDGHGLGNDSFTASLALLRDGRWQPGEGGIRLFDTDTVTGRVSPQRSIDVNPAVLRNHFRASSEPLEYDLNARGGFFKLQLQSPPGAFGHQAYPQLLTQTVSANARLKPRRAKPLPQAPYTPVIERLRFDYEARSSIHLRSGITPTESEGDVERLLHLHPFGLEEIHPAAADRPHGLLPRADHDGNLFIGLKARHAAALQGALTLLFHLRDETALQRQVQRHAERQAAPPPVRWACLVGNRWRPLPPARVLSDTTAGFLTSGIVTLDLPGDLSNDNSVMPAGLFWLRASADGDFDAFAGLYGVHAQALCASRVATAQTALPGTAASTTPQPLPAGTVKEVLVNVPGLSGVVQVGPSFGLRTPEARDALRARAGERLQHRNRASTPWDFERLVLERFPSVFKVKCFAQPLDAAQPGEVLVVVVPAMPRNDPRTSTRGPRVDAVELGRMAAVLQALASPLARVRVRNASYERIQVRCNLVLAPGTHVGLALQGLNQRLNEYLSPWHDGGYQARFDWAVRSEDVEACIRSAPEVEAVTQLSLLHIAQDDDGVYTLGDTARTRPAPLARVNTRAAAAADAQRMASAGHVRPRMPWSLALPMPQHLLGVAEGAAERNTEGQPTGISRLAVGSTFIIGGAAAAPGLRAT